MAVARGSGRPVLWLQIRAGDGRSAWYGGPTPRCCRACPGACLLAVVISALILVAVMDTLRAA